MSVAYVIMISLTHIPDRVLRHLDYVHVISSPILRPEHAQRPKHLKKYELEFSTATTESAWQRFTQCWGSRHVSAFRRVGRLHDCSSNYKYMYSTYSHPLMIDDESFNIYRTDRTLQTHTTYAFYVSIFSCQLLVSNIINFVFLILQWMGWWFSSTRALVEDQHNDRRPTTATLYEMMDDFAREWDLALQLNQAPDAALQF